MFRVHLPLVWKLLFVFTSCANFHLGEFDSNYTAIQNSPSLPTFPEVAPNRWNVLLQAFMVGSDTYSVSTNVTGAPSNNAVVLLDSGTSYSYAFLFL